MRTVQPHNRAPGLGQTSAWNVSDSHSILFALLGHISVRLNRTESSNSPLQSTQHCLCKPRRPVARLDLSLGDVGVIYFRAEGCF